MIKIVVNGPKNLLLLSISQRYYILSEYDIIVFGSAVYIGRFSLVLGNYILKNRFKNKKVIVYTIAPNIKDITALNGLKV